MSSFREFRNLLDPRGRCSLKREILSISRLLKDPYWNVISSTISVFFLLLESGFFFSKCISKSIVHLVTLWKTFGQFFTQIKTAFCTSYDENRFTSENVKKRPVRVRITEWFQWLSLPKRSLAKQGHEKMLPDFGCTESDVDLKVIEFARFSGSSIAPTRNLTAVQNNPFS